MHDPLSRRTLLQAGLTGFSSLSLAGLLRARVHAAAPRSTKAASEKTAVILVWLRGGCSHLDTFDPKPDAPTDYRGPFRPIDTKVPGMQLTELLPMLSQQSHRFSLLRSMSHTGGGHPAGSLQILGGDADAQDKPKPILPDWMSIASALRRDPANSLPNYVAVNPVDSYDSFTIAGSTYLGPAYEPFRVVGDPSQPDFVVPNIGMHDPAQFQRFQRHHDLKSLFDRLPRNVDQSGLMEAVDAFDAQAWNLLTSTAAREAFDLSREPEVLRERYGRNAWGQQCLMARRLVEAGVDVVATEFDGPLCGRVQNWDDHAVNQHVFDALSLRMPTLDRAVSALIEDIYARGLDRRVLVIVTGEFGRTPRISHVASSGGGVASAPAGTVQPGRDHWPQANTMLFSGGGLQTGRVIGATNRLGEEPIERHTAPGDFLATIYRHLGINYEQVALPNFRGRPVPIVASGSPIPELVRTLG